MMEFITLIKKNNKINFKIIWSTSGKRSHRQMKVLSCEQISAKIKQVSKYGTVSAVNRT